ncbi:hypothetical protein [Paraburkholderia sp. J67]|uniref:hypothetical protein n=1 Tax=Paraburkholderia sp. J67 TaxID=2805435 RepID=UPI0039F4AB99
MRFSLLLSEEATRLLAAMGAEVHTFNEGGLAYPAVRQTHPKVVGLRDLVLCGDLPLKLPPLDQFCTHLNSCRK